MKRILIILSSTFLTMYSLTLCYGESFTVKCGDFSNWSSSLFSKGGGDASVTPLSTGGNPDHLLEITTYTTGTAYGVGVNNEFTWDMATRGAISNISLYIDVRSISGWGQGQNIVIIAFQSGQYFFGPYDGLNTGPSTDWHTISLTSITEQDFVIWLDKAIHPDFSQNGEPIKFGFGAGNSGSGIYTQFYDNWELTINHTPIPLPTTILLFGSALFGLAGFGKRRRTN